MGGGIMALADAAEGAYASLPQKLRDILAGCPAGCGRRCQRGCMLKSCMKRPDYSARIFDASADCKAAATHGGTRTTIIEARVCWAAHSVTQPRALFCCACAAGASSFVREAGTRSAMAGSKNRSISKEMKFIKPTSSSSSSYSSIAVGEGDGPAGGVAVVWIGLSLDSYLTFCAARTRAASRSSARSP